MMTKTPLKTANISLEEMLDLRAKGLSLAQIGQMAGISKQGVSQALKRSGLDPSEIKQFKKDKSLILHSKQKLLLDQLTPERVKSMSVRDATVSFGIVFDKTRLVDGESTSNLTFLTVGQGRKLLEPYAKAECTACRTYSAGVEARLCETCRADIEARKTVAAIPAIHTGAEGGRGHDA